MTQKEVNINLFKKNVKKNNKGFILELLLTKVLFLGKENIQIIGLLNYFYILFNKC